MIKVGAVDVSLLGDALVWEAGLAIDADGAPTAYGPPNYPTLDALANAGRPGRWWGVVVDKAGDPVVQGKDDPAPGYYVSTTALTDHSRKERDPTRYVNALMVPYLAVPSVLLHAGAHLGDVAMVVRRDTRQASAAIVADIGPANRIGEGSIALAEALGIDASPRHGGCRGGVAVALFCNSRRKWPRSNDDIADQASELFLTWGGYSRLLGG